MESLAWKSGWNIWLSGWKVWLESLVGASGWKVLLESLLADSLAGRWV